MKRCICLLLAVFLLVGVFPVAFAAELTDMAESPAEDTLLPADDLPGYQAVLMAPTEILAEQHLATIRKFLEGMPNLRIELLTGNVKAKAEPDADKPVKKTRTTKAKAAETADEKPDKAKGKTWYKNINKALLPWHIAHKFLIVVSLITAISLSVVSIGDAIRKNQNVIKRANTDIEKITKLANTTDKSDEVQFSALIKSSTASETAVGKAQADAAKIWPIIEDYRTLRAEFEAEFGNNFSSKEEVVFKGQTIVPDTYWDKQNSLVQSKVKAAGRNLSITQIRNITSEAVLANQIKREIETSTSNSASNKLEAFLRKQSGNSQTYAGFCNL